VLNTNGQNLNSYLISIRRVCDLVALLGEWLSDPDPEKSKRVMQAKLQTKKIDINTLKRAYGQK
jgi:hypothetical protein